MPRARRGTPSPRRRCSLALALTGCSDTERRGATRRADTAAPAPPTPDPAQDGAAATPVADRRPRRGNRRRDGGRPACSSPAATCSTGSGCPGLASTTRSPRGGGWTLTVDQAAHPGRARRAGRRHRLGRASDERISDALLDGRLGRRGAAGRQETRPGRADRGRPAPPAQEFTVDGSSDVPTTNGGTWALGRGPPAARHRRTGGAYCIASVDLAHPRRPTLGWCAPARHGFNDAPDHARRRLAAHLRRLAARPAAPSVRARRRRRSTPFAGRHRLQRLGGAAHRATARSGR